MPILAAPIPGGGNTISATTTSTRQELPTKGNLIKVVNTGSNTIFVRLGTDTVEAQIGDWPIPAGETDIFSRQIPSSGITSTNCTHIAIVASAGTNTVYYGVAVGL